MTKPRATVLPLILVFVIGANARAQLIPTDVPPVELFEELNYDLPGLAPVKAAVETGDLSAAKVALLAHFRARPDAQERPTNSQKYDTTLADGILIGKFIWGDTVCFGPIQYKYSQSGLGDVGDVGVWACGMHLIPHLYNHPRTGPFAVYGDRSFQGDGRSERLSLSRSWRMAESST